MCFFRVTAKILLKRNTRSVSTEIAMFLSIEVSIKTFGMYILTKNITVTFKNSLLVTVELRFLFTMEQQLNPVSPGLRLHTSK